MIKEVIIQEMQAQGLNKSKMAKLIGFKYTTVCEFFKSKKGSLEIAEACMKELNLTVVKTYNQPKEAEK